MHESKTIGLLTSGAESPGMNAALRSMVRMGCYLGCKMYFIYDGYQGMIDGKIKRAMWEGVCNLVDRGGTIIGSMQCEEFRTRDGRLKAAKNLINSGISNIICIGGDGSLQGLNIFKLEWPSLVEDLVKKRQITKDQSMNFPHLGVCGLVGSVDNDFWGTEMTIGTDTALSRIIDCVDTVEASTNSQQRVFLVEVMGRHCGYLAMTAGMACEADFVFVPEWPPVDNWEGVMVNKLKRMKDLGRRLNVIIIAEGANDGEGKKITANMLKEMIEVKLGYDTRITSLGHLQRGGSPTFMDRYLGTRMGAEAVVACVQRKENQEPIFMALRKNHIERAHLTRAVSKTVQAETAYKDRDYRKCVSLRGAHYVQKAMFLDQVSFPPQQPLQTSKFTFAVIHVGNPAGGMNAATHALVRMARYHECSLLGVMNSWNGFETGQMKPLEWEDVIGWVSQGGSALGTSKYIPNKPDEIVSQMMKFNIRGLCIIGGFEAFHSAVKLRDWATDYDSLRIPIEVIPATISNNIPGVPESLGSDTALNEICRTVDKIKLSARGHKKRAFIVEVQGGYCGYLATMAAIATGADNAHIFEEELTHEDIVEDTQEACEKLSDGISHYIVIRSDGASERYTSKVVHKVFEKVFGNKFQARVNTLGHSVQGGNPSCFDRQNAIRYGAKAFERMLNQAEHATHEAEVMGVRFGDAPYASVDMLETMACFPHCTSRSPWWLQAHGLMRVLSNHGDKYEYEVPEENYDNATEYQNKVHV